MGNVLVINATSFETRVALVEDGTISEYYVERKREKGIVGNLYKGRVLRVLPGMQAAFVELGIDKAGFLYVNDVWYDPSFSDEAYDLTEGEWSFEADLADEVGDDFDAAYDRAESSIEEEGLAALAGGGVAARPGREPAARGCPGSDEDYGACHPVEQVLEDAPLLGGAPAADASDDLASDPSSSPADERGVLDVDVEVFLDSEDLDEDGAAEEQEEEPGDSEGSSAEPSRADLPMLSSADSSSADSGSADSNSMSESNDSSSADEGALASELPSENDQELDSVAGTVESAEEPAPPTEDADGSRPRDQRRGRRRGRTHQRTERVVEARKERSRRPPKRAEIQDLLNQDDEIVVQIAKGPIGSKGARITTHVSLPGRHLVFMPTVDHVGISRRIASDKERRRLRQIIEDIRPPGTGFIVRTVADGVDREKLVADARFLLHLWADINKRKERVSAPALLHPDLDLILRATRDLFGEEVERLVIDDEREYQRLLGFMELHMPALKDKVEHYTGAEPIFDAYGIEDELRRSQQRRVWLKSGGYLIIDQAEALTAIDVNSGRYIGKKNLEETITKINIEAAEEVVYQLRLRNMGGIIILDFIDMEKASNREKVYRALEEALRKDKAKTNILKISELGLVEMTRKRVRESLTRMMNEPCPYCDGRGMMKTAVTVAYDVLRDSMREAAHRKEDTLFVNCSTEVSALLTTVERDALRYTMERSRKKLVMKAQENYHREQYDLYAKNTETGRAVVLGAPDPSPKTMTQPSSPAADASPPAPSNVAGDQPASGASRSTTNNTTASARRRRRRRGRGRREGTREDGGGTEQSSLATPGGEGGTESPSPVAPDADGKRNGLGDKD